MSFDTPLDWDRVAAALDRLAEFCDGKILRIKGILDIEGSDRPVVVHAVQHLFHPPAQLDSWPSPNRQSRIVFIHQRHRTRAGGEDVPRAAGVRALHRQSRQ
ncbi:MAG: GTP-binding protein [Aliidongia sp.]